MIKQRIIYNMYRFTKKQLHSQFFLFYFSSSKRLQRSPTFQKNYILMYIRALPLIARKK